MGQPLRPVPLRQTIGRGQHHQVEVGGTVQGDRLDDDGTRKRLPESVGSGEGHTAIRAQVDTHARNPDRVELQPDR